MEEILTCESCRKQWSRERSRGRKPRFCPSCLSSEAHLSSLTSSQTSNIELKPESLTSDKFDISKVYSALLPKNPNAESLIESTKNGSKWKCPSCGNRLIIHVPISDIPTHRCTPTTVTIKQYERID